MPELPEVETVRRGLEKYVVGLKLQKVEILSPKSFEGLVENVEGATIISARRSGKGLILDFDNSYSLAIHIKMTGQLIFRDEKLKNEELSPKVGTIPNKHTHIIFKFKIQKSKDNSESKNTKGEDAILYFNDQRRFGWIRVVKTDEVMDMPFFKNMGPEPFGLGVGAIELSPSILGKIIEGKTKKIKPLIMDQAKIGGIGNIYANDALYRAKIDPRRPAKSLNEKEVKELFDSILTVMKKSFEEGGASELSFVNILGQEGNYQRHSLIYDKAKQKCKNCGTKIIFYKLAGRGTFMCPTCQV